MGLGSTAASAAPQCAPTARISVEKYPSAEKILGGNNLVQPAGKALPAQGQVLILNGEVVDSNCAPVSEVIVELWQNDPYGKRILADRAALASAEPTFAGAGRTYTDLDGKFAFITLFPAPLTKRAPFLNLKVKGQGIKSISTALFFSDDARNAEDKIYQKLKPQAQQDVTITMSEDSVGNLIGTVRIVLNEKAPFRTY
jgi:protocatechuate 3,4-dioxygenase beta subunit